MAPFLSGALAERPFRVVSIANDNNFTIARNLYALTIVAGTRNVPIKTVCSHFM